MSEFSVSPSTHQLTRISGSPFITGNFANPFSVAFSPDGTALAAANFSDDSVSVFTVDPGSHRLTNISGSPFTTGQSSGPSAAEFSPDGKELATANTTGDSVSMFSIDPSTHQLTGVSGSPFAVGTGSSPSGVAFSPDGKTLATANFTGNSVAVFSVDPSTHQLTQVSGSPFTTGRGSGPASLALSPDGKTLAAADSTGNTVSVFSVDPSTRQLTQVSGSPFTTGKGSGPNSVAFSPDGKVLATANTTGNTTSLFSVDPSTHQLTQVSGSPFTTGKDSGPDSVSFSPDGEALATANGANSVSVFAVTDVAGPPTAKVFGPADHRTYTIYDRVRTSFGCQEAAGGPGLISCKDSDGGTGDRGTLDTATPGPHAYTVTAISKDGQSTTATIHYTVIDNRFRITRLKINRRTGLVSFDLRLPGRGRVSVLETAADSAEMTSHPANGRFRFADQHAAIHRPGTIHMGIAPTTRGIRLLEHHRQAVLINLWITYAPAGGTPNTHGILGIQLTAGR